MFVAGIVYAEALSVGSDGKALMTFGNALIGCALFVVFYGSIIYYRRLHLMISKSDYVCQQAPSFFMTKPYRVIPRLNALQMQNLMATLILLDRLYWPFLWPSCCEFLLYNFLFLFH